MHLYSWEISCALIKIAGRVDEVSPSVEWKCVQDQDHFQGNLSLSQGGDPKGEADNNWDTWGIPKISRHASLGKMIKYYTKTMSASLKKERI